MPCCRSWSTPSGPATRCLSPGSACSRAGPGPLARAAIRVRGRPSLFPRRRCPPSARGPASAARWPATRPLPPRPPRPPDRRARRDCRHPGPAAPPPVLTGDERFGRRRGTSNAVRLGSSPRLLADPRATRSRQATARRQSTPDSQTPRRLPPDAPARFRARPMSRHAEGLHGKKSARQPQPGARSVRHESASTVVHDAVATAVTARASRSLRSGALEVVRRHQRPVAQPQHPDAALLRRHVVDVHAAAPPRGPARRSSPGSRRPGCTPR